MGGIGAIAEPFVVIALLLSGTWINRDFEPGRIKWSRDNRKVPKEPRKVERSGDLNDHEDVESRVTSPSMLITREPEWRRRSLKIWGIRKEVTTPNTRRFKGYFLSRLLQRFPFLVECWYWALIYWIYQLGRAITAVWIVEGATHTAQEHALQVIAAEERIHMFYELPIQHFFIKNQFIMTWLNRTYSFIHIPGSIAFLIWLFYYTSTRSCKEMEKSVVTPSLYESRRRAMALSNLLAFLVFTTWPCMPPRLLSADTSQGKIGELARSYGFVDTVHTGDAASVWTDNRFTNKLAAMPSLHFGYAFLIGLTLATIPLDPFQSSSSKRCPPHSNTPQQPNSLKTSSLSRKRMFSIILGILYPSLILTAIIATANHFILDAVIGAIVCGAAWWANDLLLNLLVIEDWFLWLVRIHKPERTVLEIADLN